TLNGQPYLPATHGGTHFNFTIPGSSGAATVGVTVTDDEGGNQSASTTINVVQPNTTVTLTASMLSGVSEFVALALGSDTVDASQTGNTTTMVVLSAVGSHNTLKGGPGNNVLQGDSGFNLLQGLTGAAGAT